MGHSTMWVAVAVGLMTIGGSSCGGGGTPRAISAGASASMSQQVDAIRTAAANHDAGTAQSRLSELRSMVASLQAQGQITSSRAAQILAAASEVATQLGSTTVATTVAATPARATPTVSGATNEGDHGGKGNGKKK